MSDENATPDDAVVPGADLPHGDAAGAASTPQADGEGTVRLGDRLGEGSPGSNQAKVEPEPPTQDHPVPPAAGEVKDPMTVGAGNPQLSRHPAAEQPRPTTQRDDAPLVSHPGQDPAEARPDWDRDSASGTDLGASLPEKHLPGTASRVPGANGEAPPGEHIETDVQASAESLASMETTTPYPGDSKGVKVVMGEAMLGTSEELAEAESARTPTAGQ